VAALIEARGGMVTNLNMLLRTDDAYLMSVLGSTRPKLRLLTNVAFSESESESVERIRSFRDADSPLVLNGVPKPIQDAWRNYGGSNRSVTVLVSNGVPPNIQDTLVNAGDSDRRITVRDFSLNRLALNADVSDALGAWLYYADAYDPAWKAYNNGQPTTIYQANVAFKAIKLPSGTNRVEFVFAPGGAVKFSTYAFIIYGLILSLACVCGFVMVLWPGARRPLPITGEGSHTARLLDDGGGPAQV